MRFIFPTILIVVAIAGFFMFVSPTYQNISAEREQITSYNEALDNSKALEAERDKLTQKYNSFDPANLSRLEKLLPDSIDNIRLVLEIENMASAYGMVLKNVQYDTSDNNTKTPDVASKSGTLNKNYGTWNLEFSSQGTYGNFVNFIKDLENNLRIVDVSAVDFSSNTSPGTNPLMAQAYKYDFKIKTYWLKN